MRVAEIRSQPTFRNKIARALWLVVWFLLFRLSPTPIFWWRNLLLRLFGAEIGAKAHPYPSARIWAPWNLVMKAGSCLGPGVDCYNVDQIVLGRGAVISQRAFLCTATHNYRDAGFRLITAPIVIGEDAWIAAEAFVGPGVTVGVGAVAGARAVVVHDVASGAVVVGNPARVISSDRRLVGEVVPMSSAHTQ